MATDFVGKSLNPLNERLIAASFNGIFFKEAYPRLTVSDEVDSTQNDGVGRRTLPCLEPIDEHERKQRSVDPPRTRALCTTNFASHFSTTNRDLLVFVSRLCRNNTPDRTVRLILEYGVILGEYQAPPREVSRAPNSVTGGFTRWYYMGSGFLPGDVVRVCLTYLFVINFSSPQPSIRFLGLTAKRTPYYSALGKGRQ